MNTDLFRAWLRQRYAAIAALNGAWRTHYADFEQIDPPWPPQVRRRDDLPPVLDWLVFRDEAAIGEDRPDDDLFSQFPPRSTLAGAPRSPYPVLYEHARLLARQRLPDGRRRTALQVTSRAVDPRDADNTAVEAFARRTAMMHGATVTADELADWPPQERALALQLQDEDVHPDRKLLMLYPRLYAHLRMIVSGDYASAPTSEPVADFDFQRPPHTEGPALFRKLLDMADRCGFPWEAADTRLPLENLLEHALVVCPTLEILDQATMQRLDDFIGRRGYAAIGPRVPMLNEQLRGQRTLARHFPNGLSEFALEIYRVGDGVFFALPGHLSAATIEFVCFESGLARGLTATQPRPTTMQPDLTAVDEDVDVVVHRHGRRRIVFVANPTALPRTFDLTREPVRRLIPLSPPPIAGPGPGPGQAGTLSPHRLTLPPHCVNAYIAE